MPPVPVALDQPATHVDVRPGGEVILTGSYYSTHDGSVLDAATTTWPKEAPGGESIDAQGLFDLGLGGFRVASRDPQTHTVHLLATGDAAPGCSAAGVTAPCLVVRTPIAARARMLTSAEFAQTLKGEIQMDVPAPTIAAAAAPAFPYLGALAGVAAAIGLGLGVMRARRRRLESPTGQLLALARRVQAKVAGADAVVAAPLGRAVETAMRSLKAGRVDPSSAEGRRVAAVLLRVETTLDDQAAQARAEEEREAADELVREVESALEAAEEASAIGTKTSRT
ncbi:MAG: hypothetical protein U0441_32150 [Polyangiaceae bacterium]